MMNIEKMGTSRIIHVQCPKCDKFYQVDRSFWSEQFMKLKLHCPYCGLDFHKEEAKQTLGL